MLQQCMHTRTKCTVPNSFFLEAACVVLLLVRAASETTFQQLNCKVKGCHLKDTKNNCRTCSKPERKDLLSSALLLCSRLKFNKSKILLFLLFRRKNLQLIYMKH